MTGRRAGGGWVLALGLVVAWWGQARGDAPVPVRASAQAMTTGRRPVLGVSGKHFVDPAGRVVILRGVNVSGGGKVPPFAPLTDLSDLDRLVPLGFNVIRLMFIWEAYEPRPGEYDESYLAMLRGVAEGAWARGMYVIVDVHQDGFSRWASRGAGDGFPSWAVSGRGTLRAPDNGPGCKAWPLLMATDPTTYRSFADFYSDRAGVRTRFLAMMGRVAAAFAGSPGVIGYDPINEPWGDERRDLARLYEDVARVVRGVDPGAILFVEGQITTNSGLQTRLPRPTCGNVAYAPHYYQPSMIVHNGWRGRTSTIDRAFAHMRAKGEEWDAPVFLGEFGAPAGAGEVGAYMAYVYGAMDAGLMSGAQWNYTPTWNGRDKDGWNGEDFHILEPGPGVRPRANFEERPYPRKVAGTPVAFRYEAGGPCGRWVELVWEPRPERGATEVFLPTNLFPAGSEVRGDGVGCWRDEAGQVLVCRAGRAGMVRVRVTAR